MHMHRLGCHHGEFDSFFYAEFIEVLFGIKTTCDLLNDHRGFRFHIVQ